MKKTQTIFVVLAFVSVFLLSFLIGRATALRDNSEDLKHDEVYTGTIPIPKNFTDETNKKDPEDVTASSSVKVKDEEKKDAEKSQKNSKDKKEAKENTEPPVRMLFPCGNNVLKPYSESAVYSKTMDDWRAHTGIDYAAPEKTPVCAAWDGIVTKVEKNKMWGYTVEIEHSGNVYTVYKNLSRKTKVKEGQAVVKNQPIGEIGKSSAVESLDEPHLHFEIRHGGTVINPESYVY